MFCSMGILKDIILFAAILQTGGDDASPCYEKPKVRAVRNGCTPGCGQVTHCWCAGRATIFLS